MNKTLIFFKIVPLAFNTLIPVSFPLVKEPLKHLFCFSIKLHLYILLIALPVLKSYPSDEFSVYKMRRS